MQNNILGKVSENGDDQSAQNKIRIIKLRGGILTPPCQARVNNTFTYILLFKYYFKNSANLFILDLIDLSPRGARIDL